MNKLSDTTILYRAITKKEWIDPDTKEIDAEAFQLRFLKSKGRYETGLSTAITPEDSYNRLNKCYGVISFSVADVRELGLDAVQDAVTHVSIINMPNPESDRKKALDIAIKLARKARIHLDYLDNPLIKK